MLELIDLKRKLSKEDYKSRLPQLRDRLLQLQQTCWREAIPTIVVFEGWDSSGKSDIIRKLTEGLEPRGLEVSYITDKPRTHELYLPWMWRFWLALPARGKMAFFDRSWNRRALVDRLENGAGELGWRRRLRDIANFERTLADDGNLLIKLFFHISKKEQKERYKLWKKDPIEQWKIHEGEWLDPKKYDDYLPVVEEMLEATDAAWSPWTILPATDRHHARIATFETLIDRLEDALESRGCALPEPWIPEEEPAEDEPEEEPR